MSEFIELNILEKLIVLQYEHIDFYLFIKKPEEIYKDDPNLKKAIEIVKKRFGEAGWEGDGKIELIWIPPFLDQSDDSNWGSIIWHVKQNNNGTSFLGFESIIQSSKLFEQNRIIKIDDTIVKPMHILFKQEQSIIEQLSKKITLIKEVEKSINQKIISEELSAISLGFIQNQIIADLTDFIDDCYLSFLNHVLSENNRNNIKLQSFNVKLDLKNLSTTSEEITDNHWYTIREIISCIWKNFKFLPFKDKFKEIQKCIGYSINENINYEINKHVIIRNCIQHHQWQLIPDLLDNLGKNKIIIADKYGNKNIEIKRGDIIKLTSYELYLIINKLEKFYLDYTKHIEQRIKTRYLSHE